MASPNSSIEDLPSNMTSGIAKIVLSLPLYDLNDFVDFYQHLNITRGPLFESSMPEHFSSQWSFFSLLPKFTITKTTNEIIKLKICQEETVISKCFFDQLNNFTFIPPSQFPDLINFPFIGGFMGYLSYENIFESKELLKEKMNIFPLYQFSLFTNVFLFNHATQKATLIYDGEQEILDVFQNWHTNKKQTKKSLPLTPNKIKLVPQIKKTEYLEKLDQIFEHIKKGDIYQANFTHKFSGNFEGDPFQIYNSLRKKNPAPFAFYYPVNEHQFILGSSPERLFQIQDGIITSSPIKGTIRRDNDPNIDENLKNELLNSSKDAAELAMIIDLIRNDLGKISEFGSVKVKDYKKLESFKKVHHLIGTVEGRLKKSITVKEIFAALFPGGSITGAPKIRSIEILNNLENEARGPYTGSAGYIDIRGNMDFNIMIRTILIDGKNISLQVGGGIVIDSDPHKEYEETLYKAQALFDAL